MECTQRLNFVKTTIALLISLITSLAHAESVSTRSIEHSTDELILSLLELSLHKSGKSFTVKPATEDTSYTRLAEDIKQGKLDVMWGGMNPKFEEELNPIRIPIFKGVLGHRLFAIPKGTQHKFNHIRNLEDLKRVTAGLGRDWGDTKILEAAGLPVEKVVKNSSLWPMLDGERFDYMPLAIHEPWSHVNRSDMALTVEKRVMLVYPLAMYFYVSKDNIALYDAIYNGMDSAFQDGSYDEKLFNSPVFKSAFEQANIPERVVIRIDNPLMHPETPVNIERYWLDVTAFAQ